MDDIFRQLGALFLGSIPTMILFLLLLLCYATLLHGPLRRVLAERHERTAGAVERAHASIAVAEARTAQYEEKLRAARLEIQGNRDRQIAGWNSAREQAVAETREAAAARVRAARAALAAEGEQTRAGMSGTIDALADQILKTVLSPREGAATGRGEASL